MSTRPAPRSNHEPARPTAIRLPGGGEPRRLRTPQGAIWLEGVRRVEPEEELLLEHLPTVGDRALLPLVHGAPALAAVLASLNPQARVEIWEPDLHAAKLLREKLLALANVAVACTPDPEPLPGATAQTGFLIVRRDSDRLLVLDAVERFSSVLPPGSPVWVVLPTKRARDFRPRLPRLLEHLGEVARTRHHVLLRGKSLAASLWTARQARFQASTPRAALELVSRPGVFCHGRPDAGGTALAETVELTAGQRLLELGCGCGTTALLLAAERRDRGEAPGRLLLVDSHARAVACARQNVAACGFADFAEVVQDDEYRPAPEAFDWVIGNPPYYADHRICEQFLWTAAAALAPGGHVAIVSKHGAAVRELAAAQGLTLVRSASRRGYDVDFFTR